MDTEYLQKLIAAAEAMLQDTPMILAFAYGSRVRGAPREESDLDVGYYVRFDRGERALSLREEMRLAGGLSARVGCEADLRSLAEAPLELRGRVLEEGVRNYCSDEVARVNLERDLLGRYLDYKPAFRALHELRLKGFARAKP